MEFKVELKQRQDYINDVLDRFLPDVQGSPHRQDGTR